MAVKITRIASPPNLEDDKPKYAARPGEMIMAAAIRRPDDGQYWYSAPPARHGDIMHSIVVRERISCVPGHWDQGFVTNRLRFVGREEAMLIAKRAGQVRPYTRTEDGVTRTHFPTGRELFTEDMW